MSKRSQSGLSLIEVMVALVVLSIGLLGIALLQMRALQSTHAAYQATLASIMATDAEERLWLDRAEGVVDPEAGRLANWSADWSGVLPATASTITAEAVNVYQISVSWSDSRFTAGQDQIIYRATLP